jgi:hypothetical protein
MPPKSQKKKNGNQQLKKNAAKIHIQSLDQKSKSSNAFRMAARLQSTKLTLQNVYRDALLNPFNPYVAGVKIPEPFPTFTTTYKIAGTHNVSSLAGVTSGGLLLRSSPSAALVNTSIYAQLGASSVLSVTSGLPAYTSNTFVYGVSGAGLASVMGQYRVVSVGFKISVTQPIGTSGGRTGWLVITPIPSSPDFPNESLLATQSILASAAGGRLTDRVNYVIATSNSILEMPGSIRVNLSEVGAQTILLSDRPTTFDYAQFYPTIDSNGYNATIGEGSDVAFTSAGVVSIVPTLTVNTTSHPGHTNYLLWFEGLPAAAQNLVDIEYIYHLEGTPVVSNSLVSPVPTGPEINSGTTSWTDIMRTIPKIGMSIVDLANEYGPQVARLARAYQTRNLGAGGYALIGN